MVAYNFEERFAPLIESGQKTQTIRQKKRANVGDTLQFYTGQRTAKCRKIGEAICTAASYCAIRKDGVTLGNTSKFPSDLDEFARADGFQSFSEMLDWFHNRYGEREFVGCVTSWRKGVLTEGAQ